MKTRLRVLLAMAAISVGCGSPDHTGEKGELGFRFGLGGCASVPVKDMALAKDGITSLQVVDDDKRRSLAARSDHEGIVSVLQPTFELMCVGEDCAKTQGAVNLGGTSPGATRVEILENGAVIDAITVRVEQANSIVLMDKDGRTSNVRTRVGESLELKAVLKNGDHELVATRDFRWDVDEAGLAATNSRNSYVIFEAKTPGVANVSVKFGDLGAQLQVTIDPK